MNIWNNDVVSMHDEIKKAKEDYFEDDSADEVTDEAIWERAHEEIDINLECEVSNLNVPLSGKIILVGDIVRWDGSRPAYRECKATNIGAAILEAMQAFDGDNNFSIDVSEGKLLISQKGHDNPVFPSVLEFREMTKEFDDLEDYSCESLIANSKSIANYVCDVFGWEYDVM